MSMNDWLQQIVSNRVDSRSLAVVRIGIGFALFLRGMVTWEMMRRVYRPGLCSLPFFDWLPRIHTAVIPIFGSLWCLAAICLMVGYRTRLAGGALVLLVGYFLALDQQFYASHLYLMGLICLLVTIGESSAVMAVDTNRDGSRTVIPSWPVTLLKLQLSIVYFFGGITKINPTYLDGSVIYSNLRTTGFLAIPESWMTVGPMQFMAVGSIVTELFLSFAFWIASLRRLAMWIGTGFHLSILFWIAPDFVWELVVFLIQMFALYSLFVWQVAAKQAPNVNQATFVTES